MSFVDLTQEEEEEEDDLAELADIGLGSPWLPPPISTATGTTKKSKSKEIAPHPLPLDDDDGFVDDDDDDEFSLGRLDSIYSSTTTSTTSSTSAVASAKLVSASAATASSKRKRAAAASKQQRQREDEDDDQDSSDGGEGAESDKQRSGVRRKPAQTKPKTKTKTTTKKKKAKRTAPEEDVLVLIDAHLAKGKDGDEYISMCQKPDKEKKPVQCDVRALPIRNSIEWRTCFGLRGDDDDNDDGSDQDIDDGMNKRQTTKEVSQVLVKYSGTEFGRLVRERGLRDEVRRIRAVHGAKTLIFLLEDLKSLFARETRRNKVRTQDSDSDDDNDEADADGARDGNTGRRVTPALVDEAVVWLQIEAKCQVRRTDTVQESAHYVYRLTAAIANAPYKQESSFSTFCAEATGKRSARTSTPQETWIKQLQQINKVSAGVAAAIGHDYPTFRSLMSVYQANTLTNQQKELLLQDIKIGSAVMSKDRRVGPALSKKIYHVFTGDDGTHKVS